MSKVVTVSKKRQYQAVSAYDARQLSAKVTEFLADGWSINGPLVVFRDSLCLPMEKVNEVTE